ncbi:MAG: ATP-binding protein [Litorimonas sp.]
MTTTISETANTTPSKSFFVDMLTRDIELYDAILDLIDNSLDGAARLSASRRADSDASPKYSGYSVHLIFEKSSFTISDNCGGIPLDIAKNYAFAMGGPPSGSINASLPTIGVYGIGMKRAIFKIGRRAEVTSRSYETAKLKTRVNYRVPISSEWMDAQGWDDLPVERFEVEADDKLGTVIRVENLVESTKKRFLKSDTARELRRKVSIHYALIIEQGFEITICGPGDDISDGRVEAPENLFSLIEQEGVVEPYIAAGRIGDVNVKVFAGFVENPANSGESKRSKMETNKTVRSGWTVACNDRIVLWRDRSVLSNWGVNKVPTYHAQFNKIAGLILLYGDSKDLPLTTTKAGIDLSHPVYAQLLDYVANATKTLINFTNKIKGGPEEYSMILSRAEPAGVSALVQKATQLIAERGSNDKIFEHEIALPDVPKERGPRKKRIVYSVDPEDYVTVANYLEMSNAKPGEVGKECFDLILNDVDE